MKNPLKIQHSNLIILIIFALIFCLVLELNEFNTSLSNNIEEINRTYLEETSNQYVSLFNIKLEEQLNTLETISEKFSEIDFNDYNMVKKTINATSNYSGFKRITVAFTTGRTLNNSNMSSGNVANKEFFKNALNGRANIYAYNEKDEIDGEDILVLAVPIYYEEAVKGVLMGTFNRSMINDLFKANSFNGMSYSYVLSSDGSVIIKATNSHSLFKEGNFFDFLKTVTFKNNVTADMVYADFKAKNQNVIQYSLAENERICVYRPINMHDWYMVTVIPSEVILNQINQINHYVMNFVLVIFLIFIIFAGCIIFLTRKFLVYKKENQELAAQNEKQAKAPKHSQSVVFDYNFAEHQLELFGNLDFLFGLQGTSATLSNYNILADTIHPNDIHILNSFYNNVRNFEPYLSYEFRNKCSDGKYYWVRLTSALTIDKFGNPLEVTGSLVNVNEQKVAEHWSKIKTEYDSLTNLLNQKAFEEKLTGFLKDCSIEETHALFILDVDNFKIINSRLGHAFGDQVLIDMAQKITKVFSERDFIGRVEDDKFIIFLNLSVSSKENAMKIIEKKAEALSVVSKESYIGSGSSYDVSASIGCAVYPDDGKSFQSMYKSAEAALYSVKNNNKGDFLFFKDM